MSTKLQANNHKETVLLRTWSEFGSHTISHSILSCDKLSFCSYSQEHKLWQVTQERWSFRIQMWQTV